MRRFLLIATALTLMIALFFLLQDEDSTSDTDAIANAAGPRLALAATAPEDAKVAPPPVDREHPGYAVYTKRGCNVCHGPALTGTNMAPGFEEAPEHWEPESFARYLTNPDSSVRANERLRALDARYGMFVMPAYQLAEEELVPLTKLILRIED